MKLPGLPVPDPPVGAAGLADSEGPLIELNPDQIESLPGTVNRDQMGVFQV